MRVRHRPCHAQPIPCTQDMPQASHLGYGPAPFERGDFVPRRDVPSSERRWRNYSGCKSAPHVTDPHPGLAQFFETPGLQVLQVIA